MSLPSAGFSPHLVTTTLFASLAFLLPFGLFFFYSDVIEVNVRTCPCASELFCVEGCMFEKKHFLFAIISCYQTLSLDQGRREGRGGMPP